MDALLILLYNASRRLGPRKYLCYSPFTSLFFGTDGVVTSCCYNRSMVLGRYPQSSIQEIWEGEQNELLRQRIADNDLSGGCAGCASQIQSGNFGAVVAQPYDRWRIDSHFPSCLQFELHNTCNLECIMCDGNLSSAIRKKREKKPPKKMPYDDTFVEQLEMFIPHLQGTTFFGGEPFLIPLYYKIWDRLIENNPDCEITVQTNGTVLNEKIASYLDRGNFHVGISLDSIRKHTLERIRVNAKFESVMENVRFFNAYAVKNNRQLGLSICVMTQNWPELPCYLEFANKLGACVFFNTVYHPKHLSLAHVSSEKLREICEYYERYAFGKFCTTVEPRTPADQITLTNFHGFITLLRSWYHAKVLDQIWPMSLHNPPLEFGSIPEKHRHCTYPRGRLAGIS